MTDYCAAPDELAKHPHMRERMAMAANGNADAFAFLWRWWNFAHVFDDLIDRDKPITPEEAMRELVAFVCELAFNEFFRANRHQLFALMTQIGATVLDADELAASDQPEARALAPCIGPGDADLLLHVAYLTGGWDHMRRLKALRYANHVAAATAAKGA